MTHSSDKTLLTISMLTFPLRGVVILREIPPAGWQPVAGPYWGDEIPLLQSTLQGYPSHVTIGIAEEQGGITIFKAKR